MNKDIIFYVAASAVAVGVGAFVFWGPSPGHRRRKVPIIGLKNLGFTCFLNSLLQALASCPIFIEWLETSGQCDIISHSLANILRILSSEASCFVNGEDALSPIDVMTALRQNGWSISPGEQDAHELFHHLILTIEEEAQRDIKFSSAGCLTDALLPPGPMPHNIMTSSRSLPAAFTRKLTGKTVFDQSSTSAEGPLPAAISNGNIYNPIADYSGRGDPVNLVICDKNHNRKPSPFTGFLTSQTVCTECGFKSVLRYDKFDSLSLHLPSLESGVTHHTLTQLLERFVTTEVVGGVSCDGCNKSLPPEGPTVKSTALKSLTIGKLPRCLCIHIPRTLIYENGEPYKRQDYVDFPEYLFMDPYTQNNLFKDIRLRKQNLCSDFISSNKDNKDNKDTVGKLQRCQQRPFSDFRIQNMNHTYRIKAVIVHRGALQGGHFVTYRRGPLNSQLRHRSNQTHGERRWYLTSDSDVRDATLSEALRSPAYMLFYEKCAKEFEDSLAHSTFSLPSVLNTSFSCWLYCNAFSNHNFENLRKKNEVLSSKTKKLLNGLII